MNILKAFSLSAVMLAAASTLALDNATIAKKHSTTRAAAGWIPSIGFTYGHLDQSGASNLDGDSVGIKGIFTEYIADSQWIADLGVGVEKFYLQENVQPTVPLVGLSTRYETGNRFSIGPVLDMYLSNGESFGSTNNQAAFLGVVAIKEFMMTGDQMLKMGLKYNSEIFARDQTSNFLGLTAEWAVGASSSLVR